MPADPELQPPRLPSCQQCRHRKVKCDNLRPKCGTCVRHNLTCDFIDSSTGEIFTGEYIYNLEKEENHLQTLLGQTEPCMEKSGANAQARSEETSQTAKNKDGMIPGIFQAGGISFLKLLFADSEWRQNNVDLLQKFAQRPRIVETKVLPNPLPDRADADLIVQQYLAGTHVQNPFLLRSDVESTVQRVYARPPSNHSKHDLFCIFMILAVGSVVPYRKNEHDKHPFGYYLAALEYFDQDFLSAGLRGVQDLLLIARFGIYHHIGTSIWEIAQICIRMCIEQGLHRKSNVRIHCVQEQLQRRVFWHCYVIDRYSSTTLGRPFAIADHEITAPFPIQSNDNDLYLFDGPLDEAENANELNDMSVFLFYVRLRQITSRMHSFFNRTGKPSSPTSFPLLSNGRIHVELRKFLDELSGWRQSAPRYSEPKCLYHRPEWHDFMYERYRLLLLRTAIEEVPKQNRLPPKELIEMIAQSSTELILLYSGMFKKGYITYTRSYFQMLFTGGLSLMFSISVMGHFGEFKLQSRSTEALQTCQEILMQISLQLQDSSYYAAIFEALHRETIRRSTFVYRQFLTSSAPTRRPSQTGFLDEAPQPQEMVNHWGGITQDANTQHGQHILIGAKELQNAHGQPSFLQSMQGPQDGGMSASNPYYSAAFPSSNQFTGTADSFQLGESMIFPWGGFSDDWLSMEAGLGEYAYGDPYSNLEIWDQLQLNLNGSQT